ncbi:MAG: DnaB-like helicase N-terminal domain-containing protein, partial [Bacteroidales bacterium]|nr:DnaB-like helicase N-terminal domain-containing protein [Bacteroidales bacterium]
MQTPNTTKRKTGAPSPSDSVAAMAALGGKLPPQAPEFEEAVLGAILLDKDALQNVVEILEPEHFYLEANQRIYAAMQRLNANMAPIDMLTMCEELKRTGELDAVGGRVYIAKLTSRVGAAVNIEYHARLIFQKYLQRSLI